MSINIAADLIYKLAETVRGYNADDAKMLRWMAETFEKNSDIGRVLGTFGNILTQDFPCPYCGDDPKKKGRWRIVKFVCNTSRDYEAGYRVEWKCPTCGEREIR